MRAPGMASRAGLFALAFVPLVMTHLCCGVTPVLPQVPVPEPDTARQEPPSDSSEVVDSPDIYGSLGLNLAVAFPFGEFSRNVSAGWGLTGDFSLRLVPSGWLGLRIDGGVIWYGHETIHDLVYLSRVPIDIETTTENYVVQGALGPQLHFAGHPMSARVYGLVGMSLFETRSSAKFDDLDSMSNGAGTAPPDIWWRVASPRSTAGRYSSPSRAGSVSFSSVSDCGEGPGRYRSCRTPGASLCLTRP